MKRWLRSLRVRFGPNGPAILRLHHELDGQLSAEESAWLFNAARARRTIVEIGSYRGKSTVLLARGCQDAAGHVTAIDPHLDTGTFAYGMEDHGILMEALRRHGVADRVTPVLKTSRDALEQWDGRDVCLLWIDGDHRYESARFDLKSWSRFVRVGGVIAAHDYTHLDSVRQAWHEVMDGDRRFGPMRRCRSIAWAHRVG